GVGFDTAIDHLVDEQANVSPRDVLGLHLPPVREKFALENALVLAPRALAWLRVAFEVLVGELCEGLSESLGRLHRGRVRALEALGHQSLGLRSRVCERHIGIRSDRHAAHPTVEPIHHDPGLSPRWGNAYAEAGPARIEVVDLPARIRTKRLYRAIRQFHPR